MITVKAGELHDIFASLKLLMDIRLPGDVSFHVGRLFHEVIKEVNIYERARMGLVDQYGEKDKDGQLVMENDAYKIKQRAKFNKEFEALQSIEVKLNITPVAIHIPNIEIEPLAMIALNLIASNDDIFQKEQSNDQRK